MRMVFTDPSVVPCDMLKGVLAGSGIPAIIKNERGSTPAGEGDPIPFMPSLVFAWPEVWVADDDYETAAAIVKDMKTGVTPAPCAWKCPRCGETVDPELDACWNCDTPKAGVSDPDPPG
jgi:hypothetical protein